MYDLTKEEKQIVIQIANSTYRRFIFLFLFNFFKFLTFFFLVCKVFFRKKNLITKTSLFIWNILYKITKKRVLKMMLQHLLVTARWPCMMGGRSSRASGRKEAPPARRCWYHAEAWSHSHGGEESGAVQLLGGRRTFKTRRYFPEPGGPAQPAGVGERRRFHATPMTARDNSEPCTRAWKFIQTFRRFRSWIALKNK